MQLNKSEMECSEGEGIQQNLGKKGAETGMEFFGLQSPFTMSLPQQSPESAFLPSNKDEGISVLFKGGRKRITPALYNQLIEKIGADSFVGLWDEVSPELSQKRKQTSIFRSAKWLEEMLKDCGNGCIWGAVLGGDSEELRRLAAEKLTALDVAGYVLCGFEEGVMPHADFETLLQSTLAQLDSNKPKFIPGSLSPKHMFTAVQMGVDLFDSSFVWDLCAKGQAIVSQSDVHAEDFHYEILDMTDPAFQCAQAVMFCI